MKKVLIIAGSPRKDGNSDLLALQFAKGAAESGNEVETVYLREKKLNYCQGCLVCLKKGECFQKDDANSLLPKMMEADVVCFSCPVYYYQVLRQNLKHKGKRIVFIHGVGDGILAQAIRKNLDEVFALSCSYTYGPMGATNVTIK